MLWIGKTKWIWCIPSTPETADRIQYSAEEQQLQLNISGASYQSTAVHLTDDSHDLAQVAAEDYVDGSIVKLPTKSVMTLVME